MISHIAVLLPQLSTLMYMERLEEREAVILSFTVPQIWCAFSLFLLVSLLNTQTHMHTHTHTPAHTHTNTRTHRHLSMSYLLLLKPPTPLLHPNSGSSCHHLSSSATPEKPIQTVAPHRHGMLAKGDGVLSGSRLQPPSLPPSPVAAPLLLLNISSTCLV